MAYELDGEQLLGKIHERVAHTDRRIRGGRKMRIFMFLFFSLFVPYFLTLFILFEAVKLVSTNTGKRLLAWLVRHYFKWYFAMRGVHDYQFKPVPTPPQPSLILTNRIDGFLPIYVYSQFKSPVIIPLKEYMYSFRASILLPFKFMGRCFKHISYPDQELPKAYSRIEEMLEAGHSVVVNINQGNSDPQFNNTFKIHSLTETLLRKDIPTYFLHVAGWESYKESSFLKPMLASTRWKSKEDLFEHVDSENTLQVISEIAEYFAFRYVHRIQSDKIS